LVSFTAKNPISAVEITAERTIRPSRIAISIEVPGLGTGHAHDRPDTGQQRAYAGDWTGEAHGGKAKVDAEGAVGGYGFHEVYIYHRPE